MNKAKQVLVRPGFLGSSVHSMDLFWLMRAVISDYIVGGLIGTMMELVSHPSIDVSES